MEYTLPQLPYSYDSLEPYIDTMTMEIHYTKHHAGYVQNLNNALKKHPHLQNISLDELLQGLDTVPEDIRVAVRNHGGGHSNHSLFWPLMKKDGGGMPKDMVAHAIKQKFGSFEQFQNQFNTAAKSVFGSGWAWLCVDEQNNLSVFSTPNQDSPYMQSMRPILGLDVWEHAYYLKYQNRRPDYITAWWHVINWDRVEEQYRVLCT